MNHLARLLVRAHKHALVAGDGDMSIVYSEADLLSILKEMGVEEKPDWDVNEDDVPAIQQIRCFDK